MADSIRAIMATAKDPRNALAVAAEEESARRRILAAVLHPTALIAVTVETTVIRRLQYA